MQIANYMQKNRLAQLLFIFSTVLLLMMSSIAPVLANGVTVITLPAGDSKAVSAAIKDMGVNSVYPADGGSEVKGIFKVSGNTLQFNQAAFDSATPESQKAVLESFTTQMKNTQTTSTAERAIYGGVQNASSKANKLMIPIIMSESGADMHGSEQIIRGGIPLIKVIFGLLAYVVIYGLILSTLLDFIYMGLPFARNFGTGGKGGDGGGEKPSWITHDAYTSIKDSESGESYSNPYFKYLLRRSWSYVLIAILISWLVVGELGTFIGLVMSIGDSFIGG